MTRERADTEPDTKNVSDFDVVRDVDGTPEQIETNRREQHGPVYTSVPATNREAYRDAWEEWTESSDAALWDATSGDGV